MRAPDCRVTLPAACMAASSSMMAGLKFGVVARTRISGRPLPATATSEPSTHQLPTTLTIRIHAAMAQKKRELISERTKAALAGAREGLGRRPGYQYL
jgi:hypothetical protein